MNLRTRKRGNGADAVGCAINGRIVDDHCDAIAREADIEFQRVRLDEPRPLERLDGILRSVRPVPAMRDDRVWNAGEKSHRT